MKKKMCLVGRDIGASLSPRVHSLIFESLKVEASYELRELENFDDFEAAAAGYDAINVTCPYKADAAKLCGAQDSVNLLVRDNGVVRGFSTDGAGFALALDASFGNDAAGGPASLVGAGGAATAIAPYLKRLGGEVTVFDRTPRRAEALAEKYDLLIGTPAARPRLVVLAAASLSETPLPSPNNVARVFDVNYGHKAYNPYPGAAYRDGLDMLIFQAILADFIVFDRLPPEGPRALWVEIRRRLAEEGI